MNEVLVIKNTMILNHSEIILEIDSNQKLENLKASGQMLVDSAGFSFVYLLENDDSYTYISVPDSFWNDLKSVISDNLSVTVTNGKETILLTQFHEELNYLIENIKGNSNYGEEMVNKVEVVFQ